MLLWLATSSSAKEALLKETLSKTHYRVLHGFIIDKVAKMFFTNTHPHDMTHDVAGKTS